MVLRTTFPPQAVGQSQGDEVPPTLTPKVCPMAKPRPFFLYDSRETRFFRHLERRYVSVWETDGKRFDDTLSREISHLNASWAIAE